ncbi:Transcription regulator [contains diacylglycerol kinase catalytic domain] [hydrothermal vent metagenome]|uniref:Transcription regulator [contains diacylglycerol kinase catalytic domain] n=1 Tax=hydrothermal vent metagenome TaxID=652676 RepID=A0A3B1DWR8_9ZZZZ
MKKYNLIILAMEEKGPLYDEYGCTNKALLPIHGKPMLDWVVEAFRKSEYIDNIIVIGSDELDQLSSMRYVRKRIMSGLNVVQNLIHGITYVKTSIYQNADNHNGYLISFCDAVFLNTEVINETIKNISNSNSDLVFHYVEKETFKKHGLTAQRTYIPIGKKNYTGTAIYYIKKFSLVSNFLEDLSQMRQNRKDPKGILKVLGCADSQSFFEIESVLSKKISAKVKIFESLHPEIGMDVAKPSDVELAKKLLSNPWKHNYKKAKIIYNPQAGQGLQLSPVFKNLLGIKYRKFEVHESKEEYIKKIKEYLSNYNISVEATPTKEAGHATVLAKECVAEGFDLVIAAGGDGTVNEIINGLVGSDVTLGVIPLGTANVFGIEIKLPIEIKAACQVIASGETRVIDLGRANGRYFVCMAGVGFDAHILKKADSKLKKMYGALAYGIVGITQLFTYKFHQIVIKIDDQPIRRKGYFVVIGNGKYYGGDMMFASKADLTDGYLDVCIFKYRNLFSVFNYLFGFHKGNIDKHLDIEYFQCKKVEIFKKGNHPVHVDAEYLCETPVSIEVCPASLKVAV